MSDTPDLSHLPAAAAWLGTALTRPKLVAAGCVMVLASLGWLTLAWLVAGMDEVASGASGVLPLPLQVLCGPLFGSYTAGAAVVPMWGAMLLAMMLPTAGPMLLTYAEIAETAARKGERIVSPLVLASGYSAVWAGFVIVASAAQIMLTRVAFLDSTMASTSALLSGAIFIGAGLYQFTPLKHACLTQCQRPFPFFFAYWQTTRAGVFRLGLTQGLYCLGCCWAMMLLMFAVGVMNVVWMAALAIVMAVEKLGAGRLLSHVVGAILFFTGVAFLIAALVAHWPAVVA